MIADNDNQPKKRRSEAFGPWVNTQEWAARIGSRFFFTGDPCDKGHTSKRSVKDGRCSECGKDRSKKAYWASPEEKREKGRDDHIVNRGRNLARMLVYANQNSEEIDRRHAAYREENREARIEYSRQWHAENKDRAIEYRQENAETYAAHARNRRARIRAAEGSHTADDIADILKRQKYKCAECGTSVRKRENRHVDHIMPLARGGSNWPWNLQVLCPHCNLSKNDLHPIDFAQRRGRLL